MSINQTVAELRRILGDKDVEISEKNQMISKAQNTIEEAELQKSNTETALRRSESKECDTLAKPDELRHEHQRKQKLSEEAIGNLRIMLEHEKAESSDNLEMGRQMCEEIVRMAYPD